MWAIALAYAGSGSNAALRQLLHVAVTDVSDDVRRAATTAIGFVLCRSPGEVPGVVAQLAESYNPHVRYGAALAVGVACAGSGSGEAVGLLEPLLDDSADFVRSGALLGLGLVLQQESEGHLAKAKAIRERMLKMSSDRHQTTLTKQGAILALGLIDVAGRNGVVSMISRSGFLKMGAVVGVAVWLQHWYWHPLLHMIALAVQVRWGAGGGHAPLRSIHLDPASPCRFAAHSARRPDG
jgi:26S proteasome regulatory subunit N2